jgi:hypothetical protein
VLARFYENENGDVLRDSASSEPGG